MACNERGYRKLERLAEQRRKPAGRQVREVRGAKSFSSSWASHRFFHHRATTAAGSGVPSLRLGHSASIMRRRSARPIRRGCDSR